jgi:hypothetical protein
MKKLLGLSLCLVSQVLMANSYVVEMNYKLSKNDIEVLKTHGVKTIQKFTPYSSEYFDRLYSVEFEGNLKDLKQLATVKLIEKDFEADFFEIKANPNSERTTNDLLFPLQWGLQSQGQIISKQKLKGGAEEFEAKKGIDIGWRDSIKSIEKGLKRSPVVAVVDMGIDLNHPELVDQMYKNEAECDENGNVPVGKRIDRDKNGYAADCLGFNFAALDPINFQFPRDDKNHGTHVAGIIAGKANNDIGISGVSDKIKILPVKVTGRSDETSDRNRLIIKAPSKRIANGILYAVKRKVDVINLSLGWPKSMDTAFMRNVIREAIKNNIVVVAAAGNNNTNGNIYPCAYENVICVGSVDANGKMSAFSNFGGEVDILAPGDQILSTIPTPFIPIKMNIQGYDILSGTSQAAPFVSAAAALLKASNPALSIYDVMRKLYDSAGEKNDSFKSQHGLMNLGNAFKIEDAPSIKPIFKLNSEIIFSPLNGTFNFLLPVRNYGTSTKNVKVEMFFKDRRVKLKGNAITFKEMKNYSEIQADMIKIAEETGKPALDPSIIRFEGLMSSKFIDKQTRFKIFITELDEEGKLIKRSEFEQEVTVSKQYLIPNAGHKNRYSFSFRDEAVKVPVGLWDKEEKRLRDNLRTVRSLYSDEEFPSYYVKYQAKAKEGETLPEDKDGIKLFFFQNQGQSFVQAKNDLFISKAISLLSVVRADYNFDGKNDYLIKTVVQPKDKDGYILYSYRDSDLAPLVGKYSDIRYYPELVNVTPDTVRLMKTELPTGQHLATPYFISQGGLPDADQIDDPWKPRDNSVTRRIYRLEILESGIIEYKARTDMNRNFIKTVKKKLKSSLAQAINIADTNVQIIQLLTQTQDELNLGVVKALASVGLGFYRENALITFTGREFSVEILSNISERLEGTAHHPVYSINGDQLETSQSNAFVSFLTDDLVTITSVSGNSELPFTFRMRDQNDRILSFLALFQEGNAQSTILETVDYVMMVEAKGDEQVILKRKVKKFSFLPGSKMSELYIPMTIKNSKGEMQPAIYVDATSLAGNNIYLLTKIGNSLIAPVDTSLNIPNNCVAKNPLKTMKGTSKYSLLCLTNDGFSLNYVDLVVQ